MLCSYIVGCLIKCNVIGAVEGFDFTHLYKKQYYAGGNVTLICVISVISFIVPLLIFPNVNKIKNRYIRWAIFAGLIGLVVLLLYIVSCIL